MKAAGPTYVVVLAAPEMGAEERETLARYGRAFPVIAVDGGYAWCERAGVPVAYAIGDFDSLGYVPSDTHVAVYPSKKDQTDCELAFDFARARGARRIFVFAAFGGRLDHELSVVQQLAAQAECGVEVAALGPGFAVRTVSGPSFISLPALQSGTVSVLSASERARGVTIEGLEYPLQGAELDNRTSLCLSNEFKGGPATILLESGTLIVIAPPECFFPLISG